MLTLSALLVLGQTCPAPTATLTIVPNAGAPDLNGTRLPRVTWSVQCPPKSTACPNDPSANLSALRTEFVAKPTETLGQGTGFQGPSGEGPLPGLSSTVVGANVQFSALVECNNPGSSARFTSNAVVFAPSLAANSGFAAERSEAGQVIGAFGNDTIPTNRWVALRAAFDVQLAPDEPATVFISGGGVAFSRTYSFSDKRSAGALMQAFVADPQAQVRFTQPGPVRLWVEFAGAKSAEATFTVVSEGAGAGGGAAATGGSGGSVGAGGGGGASGSGCSCGSAPGVLSGVLCFVLLRRRARR